MHITQNMISDFFKDEENLFMVWNEDDEFSIRDNFYLVEHVSLFISMSGSIEFQTNLQPRHADESHIQFFTRDLSVKIINVSEDYHSVGIIFSKKFWTDTLIHAHPYTTLALVHPCLEITPEQKRNILDFLSFIKMAKATGRKDKDLVIRHLILGLFCEIGHI